MKLSENGKRRARDTVEWVKCFPKRSQAGVVANSGGGDRGANRQTLGSERPGLNI